jgi:hypothetical protein
MASHLNATGYGKNPRLSACHDRRGAAISTSTSRFGVLIGHCENEAQHRSKSTEKIAFQSQSAETVLTPSYFGNAVGPARLRLPQTTTFLICSLRQKLFTRLSNFSYAVFSDHTVWRNDEIQRKTPSTSLKTIT